MLLRNNFSREEKLKRDFSIYKIRKPNIYLPGSCNPLIFSAFLMAYLFATPVHSQFAVCNQSLDVVNVAVGLDVYGEFETEGWWTIGANSCANVVTEQLTSRFVYIYATDVFGNEVLYGTTDMCIDTKRFLIKGTESCWSRGHKRVPFFEVDTQSTERWTLFLNGQDLQ